ncbi:hypothetical protein [Paraburkholderia kirstenboschensis]|uniref:Restriction endonuclease type IV Mrr domain-containing protein n=1 Tax=Paraburkholderia kirstenboschensis TaxID=1245436 RepID=A0ABZ0EA95_9BURK|nr:hypothetical protein [Paraburkholderia kirstenboschensis]WOD14158.1 hypothetical protein RW095_01135 [Paraburkholderia kirstenboschensis]
MASDGKYLEALVAFVEETLLPEGFTVDTNARVFNDEGTQIAEFDVEVRGKVGSSEIAWLIECRDRPTSGPAPGSWIEQLIGRRARFGFNKVTAVSTTGFAVGAVECALAHGIEIREVRALEPGQFKDWLRVQHIHHVERRTNLINALFLIDESEPEENRQALKAFLAKASANDAFLKSSKSGETTNAANAFTGAVNSIEGLFDTLTPNTRAKKIRLHATYGADDYFVVECANGPVRLGAIVFDGEFSVVATTIPLLTTAEYRQVKTGDVISQVASFAPQAINGMKFSTEMHKMADTGETHIVLRRLPDDA